MKKNLFLIFLVIGLVMMPLALKDTADFAGADAQAEQVIGEISPEYRPWSSALWSPPSGEVESLLFALQAAIGAGFIGYFAGFSRGKNAKTGHGR